VVLFEKNDRYIQVAIAVSNGGLTTFFVCVRRIARLTGSKEPCIRLRYEKRAA
jgi:hypothetical protein